MPEFKKERSTWNSMRNRCSNPNVMSFKYYGAKGIIVCTRWDHFKNFIDDMGLAPTAKHSIDRIDNSKGYFPENCRWATREEQMKNRSNSIYITYEGMTLTASQWSEKVGLSPTTILSRYGRGWAVDKCLFAPKIKRRTITAFGKTQSAEVWAKELKVNRRLIYYRLSKGLQGEDCFRKNQPGVTYSRF